MTLKAGLYAALIVLMSVCFSTVSQVAHAQLSDQDGTVVSDPLGRTSPRGTVLGYLDAMASDNTAKASQYLDLSHIDLGQRAASSKKLAEDLQIVLTRSGRLLPTVQIAINPDGNQSDGLAVGTDLAGTIGPVAAPTDVLLVRTKSAEGAAIWLISSETLRRVPFLLKISTESPIHRWLPDTLDDVKMAGVSATDWIAMAVIAVAILILAYLLSFVAIYLLTKTLIRGGLDKAGEILHSVRFPLAVVIASRWFNTTAMVLGISVIGRELVGRIIFIISTIAFIWLLWRIVDGISHVILRRMTYRGRVSSISVVNLARRAAKAALFIIGALSVLDIVGFDVTTGLAALGIGGLAIALGAQKTVENLVGSVTIVADQPIRVGDFCQFGDTSGTVEDIGMRSTRIRTMQRTTITIPNGALSSMQIENYATRDRFEFKHDLTLRYETTPDQMRYLLERLRDVLKKNPKFDDETARVRLKGLGSNALHVEAFGYIFVPDLRAFLAEQEDIILRFMETVEDCGSGFAFPSRTVYMADDTAASAKKTAEIESLYREEQAALNKEEISD